MQIPIRSCMPHLFKEEVVGTLLKAHALDLYDIHARNRNDFKEGGRPAILYVAPCVYVPTLVNNIG